MAAKPSLCKSGNFPDLALPVSAPRSEAHRLVIVGRGPPNAHQGASGPGLGGENSAERRTGRAHIGLSIDSPTIQNAYSPQAKYKLLVIVLPLPVTVILSGLHPMPGTKMAL